ncbi:MAG TPA: DUF4910 domain-containing protein, partial [Blastocatellia bacterium]|nr:DUF4910 domain-containing protein [Blastocatellia bacterium]
MNKIAPLLIVFLLLNHTPALARSAHANAPDNGSTFTKTPLLSDKEVAALGAEVSGLKAKDTVIELTRHHRVQASSGFADSARYIASKAKEYGLEQVEIHRYVADGRKTYHTLRSTPGWEAERGQIFEVEPRRVKLGDYDEMRVALADYSQSAEVTAQLVDVGAGTQSSDYGGRDVKGKIVLAGGNVAEVHRLACDERGAVGILSYQQNQITAWSGDYLDNVRWGHLSPYNASNRFAFMISLRVAREYRDRLARGEQIRLRASVKAEMRASHYDVVSAVIPGSTEPGEEIVFTCHLCHQKPGANDNASGAAAILETARALMALIRRGEIVRPRRTIRFIWPPEINGTLAYFAENPAVVRRVKAAVHCDMVGGDYRVTKSVLHVTRTPASLPSAVNTVGEIFTDYAIRGSLRAASGEGYDDALISPEGARDSLVADVTDYQMGSDHEVYQEGSFRIPTIYLRDWPDVFIHTNQDTAANIDPTKLKRSTFIAAASGYFLARAAAADASRLADEVFARALARMPKERARAREAELSGPNGQEESRNIIARSLEREVGALSTLLQLAPGDKGLESKVESLVDQLSGAWLLLTGKITEQTRGNRVIFTIESKEPGRQPKQSKAKEASRTRTLT